MDAFECIKKRRSIRNYIEQPVPELLINKLIESAIWAPSGKNGQPWLFLPLTQKEEIQYISEYTIYKKWVSQAPCLILVFLNLDKSYNYIRDVQSVGAAIQNILLAAHENGLGTCWIGEILNRKEEVQKMLEIDSSQLELMAAITLGYTKKSLVDGKRRPLSSFIMLNDRRKRYE